jgi:uncharacterized membrane protein
MIGKLIGVATAGGTMASVVLLNRLLSNLAGLVALAVITACLCCVVLAGGFFAAYIALLHYGLEPMAAGVVVGALVLLITLVFILLTLAKVRHLKEMPDKSELPGIAKINAMADAFVQGFLESPVPDLQK